MVWLYTYRSDSIQYLMELQRTLVCFQVPLTICSNLVPSRSKQFHVCLGALMLRAGRNHLRCMAHSHPQGHFRDGDSLAIFVGPNQIQWVWLVSMAKISKLRSNDYINIIRYIVCNCLSFAYVIYTVYILYILDFGSSFLAQVWLKFGSRSLRSPSAFSHVPSTTPLRCTKYLLMPWFVAWLALWLQCWAFPWLIHYQYTSQQCS